MWIAACIEVPKSYVLSESSAGAFLGRNADCDIVLDNDKSISRKHAQLIVNAENKTLSLVDFGSKFGTTLVKRRSSTFNLPHKIEPNKPFELQINDTIQFGSFNSCIQFNNETFKFCITRLDKTSKEFVHAKVASLNATLVSSVPECTHLISNQFSATLKMITALVLRKSIVTSKWFDFLNSNKSAFLIPDANQYSPFDPRGREIVGKEEYTVEPLTSEKRRHLLPDSLVFIPDPTSVEYRDVLEGCGAEIFDMSSCDLSNSQPLISYFSNMKKRSKKSTSTSSNNTTTPFRILVFFEEEKLSSIPHQIISVIKEAALSSNNIPVLFLSSRNLVLSVLTCLLPELQQEPSIPVTSTLSLASRSQVSSVGLATSRRAKESQAHDSQMMIDSQALDGLMGTGFEFAKPTAIPIVVQKPAPSPVPEVRTTRASKIANSPIKTSSSSSAAKISPVTEPLISPSPRKRKADVDVAATPVSEAIPSPSRRQRKKTDTPVKDTTTSTTSLTTLQPVTEINADADTAIAEVLATEVATAEITIATTSLPSVESPAATPAAAADNNTASQVVPRAVMPAVDDGWMVVTRKEDPKRSPVPTNNNASRKNLNLSSSQGATQSPYDRQEMGESMEEEENLQSAMPVDGWFSCLNDAQKRRTFEAKKQEFMRGNAASASASTATGRLQMIDEDDVWDGDLEPADDGNFVQPITIESTSLRAAVAADHQQFASRTLPEESRSGSGLKDVRRFHKNLVRSSRIDGDGRVRLADMVVVFPKESEREIQMRLEAETERRRRMMHDQLFDEEHQKGAGKSGQRRITAK